MKIDLIGMILRETGESAFQGILVDDERELSAEESLDTLIMEYAKVKQGGTSEVVVVRDIKRLN